MSLHNGGNGSSNGIPYPSDLAGVRGRDSMSRSGLALVESANDRLLAELADKDFEERFIAALKSGVMHCDRTCMNLYAQMRKLVGTQVELAVNVVNLIGASPDKARSAVRAMERVEGLSEIQAIRKCCAAVSEYSRRNGLKEPEFDASLTSVEEG